MNKKVKKRFFHLATLRVRMTKSSVILREHSDRRI